MSYIPLSDDPAQVGTRSGRKFSFLKTLETGDPNEIYLRDIAWSLSQINRFNGHAKFPYSVGLHSILVSLIVPAKYALCGLMHDATEAYLGDVASPLKRELPEYKKLEFQCWRRLAAKFKLPEIMPAEVHRADKQALALERRILVPQDRSRWAMLKGYGAPRRNEITALVVPMAHTDVYRMFLARYREILENERSWRKTG